MGCGENKITLWNLDRGYVLATIEMLDIKSPLSTLWVKCDRVSFQPLSNFSFFFKWFVIFFRGFYSLYNSVWIRNSGLLLFMGWITPGRNWLVMFLLMNMTGNNFILLFSLEWSSYWTPFLLIYSRLKGVCVENGVVVACYDQGIVCWNAHTSETILESPQSDAHYISGKYIITIANDQVNLKHAITFLLSADDQSL